MHFAEFTDSQTRVVLRIGDPPGYRRTRPDAPGPMPAGIAKASNSQVGMAKRLFSLIAISWLTPLRRYCYDPVTAG